MSDALAPLLKQGKLITLTGLAASTGMLLGFAVPLATAYQASRPVYSTPSTVIIDPNVSFVEVPASTESPSPQTNLLIAKDEEVARLQARNHRLEALLSTLRKRRTAARAR